MKINPYIIFLATSEFLLIAFLLQIGARPLIFIPKNTGKSLSKIYAHYSLYIEQNPNEPLIAVNHLYFVKPENYRKVNDNKKTSWFSL